MVPAAEEGKKRHALSRSIQVLCHCHRTASPTVGRAADCNGDIVPLYVSNQWEQTEENSPMRHKERLSFSQHARDEKRVVNLVVVRDVEEQASYPSFSDLVRS